MAKLSDCAIGDIVKLNVSGVPKDFTIVHKGLPSADYDVSCDGVWLLMNDVATYNRNSTTVVYETRWATSYDTKKYENCDFNREMYQIGRMVDNFVSSLDSDIAENYVKEVKIPYVYKVDDEDGDVSYRKGSNGFSAKAFILSAKEVYGEVDQYTTEGGRLDYFSTHSESDYALVSPQYGSLRWWLRSVYLDSDLTENHFGYVDTDGSINEVEDIAGRKTCSWRPTIILPYNLSVKNGFVVTSSFSGNANISGVWKDLSSGYVNVNGVWKGISSMYTNVNGIWKPMA